MNEVEINKRSILAEKQNYKCVICGKPLGYYGQFAHKIDNTKTNRSLYGSKVVDSIYNGEMVCSLECNKKVSIRK